jgi:hypothetical protein
MAPPRRVIALVSNEAQRQQLQEIARSRTEPASRVERAPIILEYLAEPSAMWWCAVGVTAQTVTRCLERAAEFGMIEALDDRPRAGRDPTITSEARTWLVALACQKPKELGYPHGLWTTRLLAAHARDRDLPLDTPAWPNWRKGRFARSSPSTRSSRIRCATTWRSAIRNSSPRWRKSCAFIARWRCCASPAPASAGERRQAIISYDEKPGIQAIGTTAPDLPPMPGRSSTVMRDHEYKRHGTVTLMAGIDLVSGHVHALVKDRHRSRELIELRQIRVASKHELKERLIAFIDDLNREPIAHTGATKSTKRREHIDLLFRKRRTR